MAGEEGIRVKFTGDASGIESAAKRAGAALKSVSAATGQANATLLNFTRVIQDAPFGLIGIANNIDPLVQSFQQLKSSTGSASSAFKLLAGSLIGPAGIALGVSAATSLLIAFGDKLFSSGTSAKKASADISEYVKAVGEARKELSAEAAKVDVLVAFIQRENISRNERIAAIKQLQSIAPAYFSQLNAEKATVEQVTSAYKLFTANILNSIKARVREGQLQKIIEERLKLEDLLQKRSQETVVIDGKLVKARSFLYANDKDIANNQARINLLKETELKIANEINSLKPPDLRLDQIKPPKETKVDVPEIQLRAARVGLTFSEFLVEKSTLLKAKDIAPLQDILSGVGQVPLSPTIQLPEPDPAQIERIKGYLSTIGEFAQGVGEAITVSIGGAFTSLFEGIASGSQSAFSSFAQALGNIIKRLLATAAAAAVLSAILGPLGMVKGASGASLKGFDLFKSIFGKIGGFAEGGVSDGPRSGYLTMLHGKEVITPWKDWVNLMQGNSSGNERLIARVSGADLLFVLNRAERSRSITG